jgi:hypothetical protein
MTKIPEFKRREWVTHHSDPTVVVEYSNKEYCITITEFQGIYDVSLDGKPGHERLIIEHLGAALHKALEEIQHKDMLLKEYDEAQALDFKPDQY